MTEKKKRAKTSKKKVSPKERKPKPQEATPAPEGGPAEAGGSEVIVSPRDTIHDPEVYQKARDALDRISWKRDWSDWLLVAEALSAGRTEAMKRAGTNQPIGRLYNKWFAEVLKREELGTDRLDSTSRSSLFDIAKHRGEIEAWRDSLPLKRRRELNSPNAVLRNWKKVQPADPDRPEKKKKRNPNAELREANAELSEQLEQQSARIKEMEEERDQYKREVNPQFDERELETKIIGLESEVAELKQERDSRVCSKCGAKMKRRKEAA
jgi:hypothetical protein